jgi:hypothetical protein
MQHGRSFGLLTKSGGRAMAADPRPDRATAQLPRDGGLHARLKSEGRLNLLYQFSERAAAWFLPRADTSAPRPNVLPFISRAEHLAWRATWKGGRWCKLSPPAEERNTTLLQDEAYRQADARWDQNHGPVPGGASVLRCRSHATANGRSQP